MSHKEILEQAITKAIAGGWDVDLETVLPEMTKRYSLYGLQYSGPSSLLFNHEFAKALWGEASINYESIVTSQDGAIDMSAHEGWQYHLQAMVIADDPIQYLADNMVMDMHKDWKSYSDKLKPDYVRDTKLYNNERVSKNR